MNRKVSNKIVGIDLGTTNSCIAVVKDDGSVQVLENKDGFRTTPSVVSYEEIKEAGKATRIRYIVGNAAKDQSTVVETIFSIKSKMGKPVDEKIAKETGQRVGEKKAKVKLAGKELTPEEVSAEILRYLVECAEEKLGEKITGVVITVPAKFNDSQRQATKDAGTIAGLKVERIINEPTAAALAYGLDKVVEKEQIVLVYDLGGGTFDVSVLSISKVEGVANFEVISTQGDDELGGDDFNERIFNYLLEEFQKETSINLREWQKDEVLRKNDLERIRRASEKAKHDLSSKFEAKVLVNNVASKEGRPCHLNLILTRAKFVELTKDLMAKTAQCVEKALNSEARKIKKEEIDQIILVGGSTRMPMVEELIKKIFGESKKINKSVNPDEVVAVGAAIQAGVLAGKVKDVLLLDVTSLSLGIKTENDILDKIIPQNTTIPTKAKRIYSTAADYQTSVFIEVYQGERPKASEEGNRRLGGFELSGIEPQPRGIPQIEVEFDINSDGILTVSATDKKTNKSSKVEIKDSQNLSKEEVEKMRRTAEERKAKDEKWENNVKMLNYAQTTCYTLEKEIKEIEELTEKYKKKHSKDFSETDPQFQVQFSEFKKIHEELKQAVEAKNYSELEEKWIGKMSDGKLISSGKKLDELMKLDKELGEKKRTLQKEVEEENKETPEVQPEEGDKK